MLTLMELEETLTVVVVVVRSSSTVVVCKGITSSQA